ncbi:conserved hypothetical protein [Culex quinquefasciatus]|uniref:Ionotropic glutamate receptor C-terminal domain-containing protein n=1 Tax=Culex quinquefasciatus TaxID=7176 RepID=B0WP38_CULQU|nr:conserved hypothetical protein [Culex quinquefasciatus]|eukprot:XP_001850472.1 conserved hypothetical protein [Culex quinquefasciatus]
MEIWLFKSSSSGSYSEALLDRLIAAEPFAGHPKILLDEFSAAGRYFGRPALVIAFFGANEILDPLSGIPKGFDVQLVNLVINRMNAELQIHYETCDPNVKEEMVVVVPRGTPLNVFELLRAPYSTLAWNVVIFTTILGLMVAQIIWKHSAVNLFLLILCELGESTLDRKKPAEKLLILGFIMLVYLLLFAYEAKLVSFLADWPYNPDINSIDDLQQSRILLLANYVTESVLNDPRLRGITQKTNVSLIEELFAIPPDTGFLSQHEIANIILQKQLNVDRRTGRTRFIMLEERLGSNLAFFYFGLRNPLKSRFAQLQQRVYESGLNQHWIRTFAAQQSFRAVVDEPPKMIRFEQLQQLAMVFVALWMCLIEFQISIHSGVFSCVFWDVSPQTFFDDTLDVILKSPQMDHVVKYVANGTNYADAQLLPWDVSMVIVQLYRQFTSSRMADDGIKV